MRTDETTIAAIATPPGRGGIGIVRLSGPEAFRIARQMATFVAIPTSRTAHYRILRDEVGTRVDDALLTFFPAPHSYTGEDVVEIATHGAPVVLDWIIRRTVALGATPARAGEFTERAFLNHRLDLTGAEAVRDLIDAQTLAQAQQAAEQVGGSIASAIRPAKQALIELIATMEAGIDFAEDDIDTLPSEDIVRRIDRIQQPLVALLASFAHGRLLRDGLRLAIIGRPNAGKSSLFNRLVQRERAIVTATPGTTRDVIAERIALDGIPIELLDTAGLRDTADEAERIGVVRTREAAAEADAILLIVDLSEPQQRGTEPELLRLLEGRPVILVQNKCDLVTPGPNVALTAEVAVNAPLNAALAAEVAANAGPNAALAAEVAANAGPNAALAAEVGEEASRPNGFSRRGDEAANTPPAWPRVRTSAMTGEGITTLQTEILHMARGSTTHAGSATLTNLRQHDAVDRARTALHQATDASHLNTPHEMILLDLHQALQALDELTGQTTTDDLLNLIFSTFCIGK